MAIGIARESILFPVSNSKSWINPITNPFLTLDCGGRSTVEFYVKEPTGSITVNIYGSRNSRDWRKTTEYTTDANGIATDVLSTGYQYVGVEIVNTALGDYLIEISASR